MSLIKHTRVMKKSLNVCHLSSRLTQVLTDSYSSLKTLFRPSLFLSYF